MKSRLPSGWNRTKEIGKQWSEEEIERTVEALDYLPEKTWLNTIKGIYRAKRSADYPNPASSTQEAIVLYDTAFDSSHNLARTLAHELAHEQYRNMTPTQKRSYEEATNWINVGPDEKQPLYVHRRDGFVELDGKDAPSEDFSNNVEYYLFEPEKLKEITPSAHEWLKKEFGVSFKVGKGIPNEK